MALMQDRRGFLTGFGALLAAPAIVRCASLMPVRGLIQPFNKVFVYTGTGENIIVTQIDILYDFLYIKPDWMLLAEYDVAHAS